MSNSAANCRVLIVEDEVLIGLLLEDMIVELGHSVSGNASSLAEATEAAERGDCNVAILDVNLRGEQTFDLADRLSARGIPIVFSTGSGRDSLPPRFSSCAVLEKPYVLTAVEKVLGDVTQGFRGTA
jgi:CheY-like chemotaxis protein